MSNNQQTSSWENWSSAYFALACDYLMHFLPVDPNISVLPHIPNYTGKVPMVAPLQTANRYSIFFIFTIFFPVHSIFLAPDRDFTVVLITTEKKLMKFLPFSLQSLINIKFIFQALVFPISTANTGPIWF